MKTKVILSVFVLLASIYLYTERRRYVDIRPLQLYALSLEPCSQSLEKKRNSFGREICSDLPVPPPDVAYILNYRTIDTEYRKYVLLMYLKLYQKQLIQYHQSFDVRESPFFYYRFSRRSDCAKAFCETIGENFLKRKLGPEFLPANLAIDYIQESPELRHDSLLRTHLEMIDSIQKVQATFQ
jgi:hypothetical protein